LFESVELIKDGHYGVTGSHTEMLRCNPVSEGRDLGQLATIEPKVLSLSSLNDLPMNEQIFVL
jgi:hypothetical protein